MQRGAPQQQQQQAQQAQKPKKKGEIQELQDCLNSNKLDQKKEAVRKIIDAMTRGKDVSILFPDMVKNMETQDMELKKLIYLYIINYAKSMPDLAILAINSFRKDAKDKSNPFLRALAVRTMGCIRVKMITEYLFDPLKFAIKDEDSYVRKTAAICIAKMYDIAPDIVEEQGFLKLLDNLVNDGNAMVVSNAICSQMQIQEAKGETILNLTPYAVQKLLTAMNECNEWGSIYILDSLQLYSPADSTETENILERVSTRLSHQNPGVVLSATKVIMKYLDFLSNPEQLRNYSKKLTQPLITLLSAEPEIQFATLKNINLIIQKRPIVIEGQLKAFFCNFNDPIFIKLQKIEILIKLTNNDNIHQILHELKDYTSEVDVEYVRKAVRAIGRCAIKLEKAAEKCVQVLWECLKTKVNYVVQETIIVIRDIFRKYPRKYEAILKDLCDNLKSLDDPEAKASMVWIIGEYVDTIENADQLISNFAENFKEEQPVVQHQILSSCVKLFLNRPQDGYEMVQNILKQATQEIENPDLRDRGYIYWRLLGTDPELTKKVVYTERPTISDQSYTLESEILDKLIENIGTLSSIYYKTPEQFVKKLRDIINQKEQEENEEVQGGEEFLNPTTNTAQQDMYGDVQVVNVDINENQVPQQQQQNQPVQQNQEEDLLGMDDYPKQQPYPGQTSQPPTQETPQQQTPVVVEEKQFLQEQQFKNIKIPMFEVLNESQFSLGNKVNGLYAEAAFQRENDKMFFVIIIANKSPNLTFSDFAIKFNANSFKLAPNDILLNIQSISPGQKASGKIEINTNGQSDNQPPSTPFKVQCALKTNYDVFVFTVPCSLSVLLIQGGQLTPQQYQEYSQKMVKKPEQMVIQLDSDQLQKKFEENNIFTVGSRTNPQGIEMISFSGKIVNEMPVLIDIILDKSNPTKNIQIQAPHPSMLPLLMQALNFMLKY